MLKSCKEFKESSAYIKNWISKQPEVGEESITDWFLFNISEKLPLIKYKQFSRFVEGRETGADWEWWFVFSNSQSFATRIQAKKIKLSNDNYPGLAHTTNGKLQIDKLINDAKLKRMASFYVFYTNSNKRTLCKNNQKECGVYWSEANKVRTQFIQNGRKKVIDADILAISTPIECLFCCPLNLQNDNRIEVFKNYLKSYFPTDNDLDENSSLENFGFQETPKHISILLEREEIPESYENEYGSSIEGIKSILIIDMRNKM